MANEYKNCCRTRRIVTRRCVSALGVDNISAFDEVVTGIIYMLRVVDMEWYELPLSVPTSSSQNF